MGQMTSLFPGQVTNLLPDQVSDYPSLQPFGGQQGQTQMGVFHLGCRGGSMMK